MILQGAMMTARETFGRSVTHRLVRTPEGSLPAALEAAAHLAELEPNAASANS